MNNSTNSKSYFNMKNALNPKGNWLARLQFWYWIKKPPTYNIFVEWQRFMIAFKAIWNSDGKASRMIVQEIARNILVPFYLAKCNTCIYYLGLCISWSWCVRKAISSHGHCIAPYDNSSNMNSWRLSYYNSFTRLFW